MNTQHNLHLSYLLSIGFSQAKLNLIIDKDTDPQSVFSAPADFFQILRIQEKTQDTILTKRPGFSISDHVKKLSDDSVSLVSRQDK